VYSSPFSSVPIPRHQDWTDESSKSRLLCGEKVPRENKNMTCAQWYCSRDEGSEAVGLLRRRGIHDCAPQPVMPVSVGMLAGALGTVTGGIVARQERASQGQQYVAAQRRSPLRTKKTRAVQKPAAPTWSITLEDFPQSLLIFLTEIPTATVGGAH
jgi:hypothetical protein